jgi:hypothetical protein
MARPSIGQVVDGFRYVGGDPNSEAAWANAVMQDSKADQEALVGARDQASKSLQTAIQAGRYMALNKDHGTGGVMSAKIGGFWGLPSISGSDIARAVDPAYNDMEAITSAVAPGLRPPGSGSSSDKDAAFYRQGFPNLDNQGDANMGVTRRLHDDGVRDSAKSAYLDSWFQHKGTLLGAEPAFQAYWQKHGPAFASRPTGAAPAPQQSAGPAPPKVGDVQDGHVFRGGNPADPHNWAKAQ